MTLSGFLALSFAWLLPAFLCMAILVKLTHAVLAPRHEGDPRVVWWSAVLPGVAATLLSLAVGLWPLAFDCAVSAVALGLLGRRYVPAPPFEA